MILIITYLFDTNITEIKILLIYFVVRLQFNTENYQIPSNIYS